MEGKVPLVIAIVSGTLAIAIVAVDLQYGIEAELQEMQGGDWVSVASKNNERPGYGCTGPELRLVVENNRLIASDVPITISYWSLSGGQVTLLSETWHMARGETRTQDITVPEEAFEPADGSKVAVSVDVQVGDDYFGTCVEAA